LLDPLIYIKPTTNQIDEMIKLLDTQIKNNEKTFITVITIKMAEELSQFLHDKGYKVAYLHNELKTTERTIILNNLRKGVFDAIIGINLLREGLDIPEVSLVIIFDADKPGLFRSTTSLIQLFGRAARNSNGYVVMFADTTTKDMKNAIDETNRRRKIQEDYNKKNNIIPTTIQKSILSDLSSDGTEKLLEAMFHKQTSTKSKTKSIAILKKKMIEAANAQDYEKAAYLRDLILELESNLTS
jgi:excinuclease ABC subunit B